MTRGVYCFTNKINGKQYIGQSMNIEKRYSDHKTRPWTKSCKDKDTAFYKALVKYGFNNFDFSIVDECGEIVQFFKKLSLSSSISKLVEPEVKNIEGGKT